MGFAKSKPPLYWCPYARSFSRVHHVHVERDGKSGRAVCAQRQTFFHDRAHALLIDVAHSEDANTGALDGSALAVVHISHADQHAAAGGNLGAQAINTGQSLRAKAEQRGKGHAVHVAAGARFWRVHVRVSIDPDQTDGLAAIVEKFGDPAYRPGGHGMIAAER